jgi:competence protein ComFB
MAILELEDLDYLKNEAEQIVLTELEQQLKYRQNYICDCKECMLDVMALALNSIKALYRVSLMGRIYTGIAMEEKAYANSIHEAVFKAIEKVHKKPSHPIRVKKEEDEITPDHLKT